MRWHPRPTLTALLLAATLGCSNGSTGSGLVSLAAFAAGPEGLAGEYDFETEAGYHVLLTQATLRIGAVYLNRNVPAPGAQEQRCVMPGLYVAEVTAGLRVDALSGAIQPFPVPAQALEEQGRSAELWLKGDDVDLNAPDDATPIVELRGHAERGEESWPFEAELTIGRNRRVPDPDPARPGANPICGERIVSPIPVDLRPRAGARLIVRVDPARWFRDVDFEAFTAEDRVGERYRFRDAPSGTPSTALYHGVHAARAYSVTIVE